MWKYAWMIWNGCLLQRCYFFVHMLAILLVLACSVFRKPTQIYRGFELFFNFALASTMTWWIHHECLRFSVDKCQPIAKVCNTCKVVCFLNRPFWFYSLTRLQIIQIAVENQCKKKARGNPLRILNLPFEHSHNSLRDYCASQIFHLHLTKIPCESIAHPKSLSRP